MPPKLTVAALMAMIAATTAMVKQPTALAAPLPTHEEAAEPAKAPEGHAHLRSLAIGSLEVGALQTSSLEPAKLEMEGSRSISAHGTVTRPARGKRGQVDATQGVFGSGAE